jgi:hypothetical protein
LRRSAQPSPPNDRIPVRATLTHAPVDPESSDPKSKHIVGNGSARARAVKARTEEMQHATPTEKPIVLERDVLLLSAAEAAAMRSARSAEGSSSGRAESAIRSVARGARARAGSDAVGSPGSEGESWTAVCLCCASVRSAARSRFL